MSSDAVRLGFVGAGNITRYHLDALRQVPGAKAVAICDVEERARQRAAEYGIDGVYTDYRRMVAEAPIDAVIVAVPNIIHHEVTVAALQAGKHVLCEKPMAINAALAGEMVRAAEANGRLLAIGLVCRYARSTELARAMIAGGELGKVYYARALKVRRKGIPGWGTWFTQKKVSGGGPVIDIGVHSLDLAWFAMGCPRPVAVCGVVNTAFGPQRRGVGPWGQPDFRGSFDVEDMGAGFIRFADGAAIYLETSWAMHTPDEDKIHIMGEQAGIQFAPLGKELHIFAEIDGDLLDTIRLTEEGTMNAIFEGQMRNFTSAIANGTPVRAPGRHGLIVTRMLEAIYTSAQSGREVRFDEMDCAPQSVVN